MHSIHLAYGHRQMPWITQFIMCGFKSKGSLIHRRDVLWFIWWFKRRKIGSETGITGVCQCGKLVIAQAYAPLINSKFVFRTFFTQNNFESRWHVKLRHDNLLHYLCWWSSYSNDWFQRLIWFVLLHYCEFDAFEYTLKTFHVPKLNPRVSSWALCFLIGRTPIFNRWRSQPLTVPFQVLFLWSKLNNQWSILLTAKNEFKLREKKRGFVSIQHIFIL